MTSETSAAPIGWVRPLAATLTLQTANAYLSYVIPTLAPVVSAAVGASDSFVGHLTALSTVGSILLMLVGTPLIRRFGAIRSLQAGTLLAGIGVLLLLVPNTWSVVAGTLLMGIGYGPSSPAGSNVLQRYAPPQHRNLIFSIRQAGVPLSGTAAGIALPLIYHAAGWNAVIAVSFAVALLAVSVVQPVRARIDGDRVREQRVALRYLISPANLMIPLNAVSAAPGLRRIALAGACLAVGQGCWIAFLVTYLTQGLNISLVSAGVVFASMQAAGIFGRLLLGWLSDRLRSGLIVLKGTAIASGATSLLLVLSAPSLPFPALCALAALAGTTVVSWNGVQIAEIARRVPRTSITASASGATILVFLGFVIGPAVFALLLDLTQSFTVCFMAVAATTAVGAILMAGVGDVPAAA